MLRLSEEEARKYFFGVAGDPKLKARKQSSRSRKPVKEVKRPVVDFPNPDMPLLHFVIATAPRTKKNHSTMVFRKGKKPVVLPSKQYQQYVREAEPSLFKIPRRRINVRMNVKALFYKDTQQLGDLVGYLQALDDLLVDAGVIEDDNESIIMSHDGSRVLYDKDFPRTEVWMERKWVYEPDSKDS